MDERPKVTQRKITIDDSAPVLNTTYIDVANSFLERITARPKIIPYTDMVPWIVDNLSITERKIMTMKHTIIGLFTGKDLSTMYHFP